MEPVLSGEAAAVDADAVCQHLFTRIPSEHFHSPMLAFEFVQFCRDHLVLFGSNLDLLRTSFPNLFKACELGPWGSGHPCSGDPCPWEGALRLAEPTVLVQS